MPELSEVEITRRQLETNVSGKEILGVDVRVSNGRTSATRGVLISREGDYLVLGILR